jgi:hypothetical protein
MLFAFAVNSAATVAQQVAWHHSVIVECENATFTIELLQRGVCVRAISNSEPRTAQAMSSHRLELKSSKVSSRKISVAEELENLELDCERGLQPVIKWLDFVVKNKYDVFNWNCQHFSSELLAVLSSFSRRNAITK